MPWWVPLVIAAAGTAAKHLSDQQGLDRQTKLTDAMTQYRSGKAAEGRAAIENYTNTLEPAARKQQLAGIEDQLGQSLEKSIDTTKQYERPEDFGGKISSDYLTARAAGRGRTDERLSRAMEQLRVINAPRELGLQDSFGFSTAAGKVDAANTGANAVSRAYQAAIDRAMGNQALRRSGELGQMAGRSYGGRSSSFGGTSGRDW